MLVLRKGLSGLGSRVINLTMNSPSTLNALSSDMLTSLLQNIKQCQNDANCEVIVLSSSSQKAFSAGHNINELVTKKQNNNSYHAASNAEQIFELCSELMLAINKAPQPVIASVDGIATAAGCQLVGACDLAIATTESKFATSGISYGLFCSTPAVSLCRNINRKHAMHMLLTGEFIDSEMAKGYGLINKTVIRSELDKSVIALCLKILSNPHESIAIGKKAFYEQLEVDLKDAYKLASHAMVRNLQAECATEGFGAFLEKRKPQWKDPSLQKLIDDYNNNKVELQWVNI